MSDSFFEELGIPISVVNLEIDSVSQVEKLQNIVALKIAQSTKY